MRKWIFLATLFLAGCGYTSLPDPDQVVLSPIPAEKVSEGRELYREHCASCHGKKGEGQPLQDVPSGQLPAPPHDDTGHTWHHTDEQLINIVQTGTPNGMPAFEEALTGDQTDSILSYIKTMWTSDQRQQQWELNQIEDR